MNTSRKKRLGRGLDALLGETVATPDKQNELRHLPIDLLRRGQYQPRTRMDETALEELARSIKNRGVVQPVVVRPLADGDYEIIAGERRWRAAQAAGLAEVPVVIRDIPDEAALVTALIENIQREDLNPIEEASGLRRLLDEFGLTHEQVAAAVGRSRSAVTNMLRLLSLGREARQLLESGELEMGHARALLPLPGPRQDALAREVVRRGLSVRQTEALVRNAQRGGSSPKRTPRFVDPDISALEQSLSDKLAAKVTVRDNKGKGRIIIEYHSLDQLDGLLKRIR